MRAPKPADHGQDPSGRPISTISRDLVIIGKVMAKGEIQLEGQLQGDINCASLILGESSQLEGGVVAEDVVIRGRLKGSVRALRVTLQSKCHVEGDLVHQSLAFEQGAMFEGKSRRADAPLSPNQESPSQAVAVKPRLVAEPSEHTDNFGTKYRRSL